MVADPYKPDFAAQGHKTRRRALADDGTTRTNAQNRWYWGTVIPMVQERLEAKGEWLDKEETHEYLKRQFLAAPVLSFTTGETTGEETRSITGLSKAEFSWYLTQIWRWMHASKAVA
jgi:hypothetical protein